MADKIDQLTIGNTSYDIDLPPDATPSIASLTTSGNVQIGGSLTDGTNSISVANIANKNSYLLLSGGTLTGTLTLSSQDDALILPNNAMLKTPIDSSNRTIYGYDANADNMIVGSPYAKLLLRGQDDRPIYYNGSANKTLALSEDIPATVSGTNDGTNWTSITIGNDTYSIPSGGGSSTDVQINGTSITSGGIANILTQTAYNASSNKIATMSDLPDVSDMATQTWVGNQGYITGITSTDVTTALGFTPYDSSNPSGYTSNAGTVTSVNDVSPDSNGNVTISIPSEVTENTVSGWGFTKNVGTVTDVQIGSTSITSSGVANFNTTGTYNSSSNPVVTKDAMEVLTTAPSQPNTTGMLKVVVLSTEPSQPKQSGYVYLITEA